MPAAHRKFLGEIVSNECFKEEKIIFDHSTTFMKFKSACNEILLQLSDLVHSLSDGDFVKPVPALSHSTIGQHVRHTLEFFLCFEQGCSSGFVNYDLRSHDKSVESDRGLALDTISRISSFVSSLDEDRPIRLEVSYDPDVESFESFDSTTGRELVYNIEHAVHHMAIIKIGVREVAPEIQLPEGFGIAASTIRHKRSPKVSG